MGIRLKNVEMKIRKKRPENRFKKFLKKFEKNTCIVYMMIGVQMILADGKASHLLPLLRNPNSSSQRFHIQFLLHRICCPFFL
jgi:hypothetical protein